MLRKERDIQVIPKISFGNIIKVNAPLKSAEQIVLYSKAKTPSGTLLKKILNEGKQKPYAFELPSDEKVSYIVTGKDAAAYWASYCSAWGGADCCAYSHHGGDDDYIAALANDICDIHQTKVSQMVENSAVSELDVQYDDETGEMKSVNIIV